VQRGPNPRRQVSAESFQVVPLLHVPSTRISHHDPYLTAVAALLGDRSRQLHVLLPQEEERVAEQGDVPTGGREKGRPLLLGNIYPVAVRGDDLRCCLGSGADIRSRRGP